MSLETCLDAIDALKKKRVDLQDPTWIPDDLVDILLLLPRRAKEQDFRDCVFVLGCIRVARSIYQPTDWLPDAVEVEGMLRISDASRRAKSHETLSSEQNKE